MSLADKCKDCLMEGISNDKLPVNDFWKLKCIVVFLIYS